MSTTVDDLMISLTIKPTSDLGRLQKQLDALTGKRGMGGAFGLLNLRRDIRTMNMNIKDIQYGMAKLQPAQMPSGNDVYGQRIIAGKNFVNAMKVGEKLVDVYLRTGSIKQYQKIFKTKDMEEIRKGLWKMIQDDLIKLYGITIGSTTMSPEKQEKINDYYKQIISLSSPGAIIERGKGMFNQRRSFLTEDEIQQNIKESLIDYYKIAKREYPIFPIQKTFRGLENLKELLEKEGISTKDMENVLISWDQKEEFEEKLKKSLKGKSLTTHPRRVDLLLSDLNDIQGLKEKVPELYEIVKNWDKNAEIFVEMKKTIESRPEAKELIRRIKEHEEARKSKGIALTTFAGESMRELFEEAGIPLIEKTSFTEGVSSLKHGTEDVSKLLIILEKGVKIKNLQRQIEERKGFGLSEQEVKAGNEPLEKLIKEEREEIKKMVEGLGTILTELQYSLGYGENF